MELDSTSCISMMARCGLTMAHSSLACSTGAPGTRCATASSDAVLAASKCPAGATNAHRQLRCWPPPAALQCRSSACTCAAAVLACRPVACRRQHMPRLSAGAPELGRALEDAPRQDCRQDLHHRPPPGSCFASERAVHNIEPCTRKHVGQCRLYGLPQNRFTPGVLMSRPEQCGASTPTCGAAQLGVLQPCGAGVGRHGRQARQLAAQRQDGAPRPEPRLCDRQSRPPVQPALPIVRPRVRHLL